MRRWFMFAFVAVLCVGGAGEASAASGNGKGTVTVVHGLPGFTADVYLDDELVLDGFEPTTATDPLRLDAGTYDLDLRDVGAAADSPPALSERLRVSPGSDISVVAHLTQNGAQTVSVFDNSVGRVPAGASLLLVRDVADAPTFWVRVDGTQQIRNLQPGNERVVRLEPGRHTLAIESRTSGDALIPRSDILLDEGTVQIVYVIGESSAGNLDLLLQSTPGLRTRPSGVLTGDGGLAARPDPIPPWATITLIAAGSTLGVSALSMAGRRRAHA